MAIMIPFGCVDFFCHYANDLSVFLEILTVIAAVILFLVVISFLVLYTNRRRIPPPCSFIQVYNTKLHYYEKGAGSPVVLIHGSNGSLQDYKLSVMDDLSKNFRIISFDRPGHGHSDRQPERQVSCAVHGQLIMDAWKKLGAVKPIIVGHSSGGAVVMDIAVRQPESISAVVLIAGVIYSWGNEAAPATRLYKLISHKFIGVPLMWTVLLPFGSLVGRWMLKFTFAPDTVPSDYRKIGIALALRPKNLRAEAEDLSCLQATLEPIESAYPDIKVPLIIVYGEKDSAVPPDGQSLRLHQELPSSVLVSLPETGHLPMFTKTREVIKAIEEAYSKSQK
jgi:pimeloyl-ACP methyl ester carboxylesterase